MVSVVVVRHKVKRVYPHGKGKPKHFVKKRVHYKIVCHTGRFTRCLKHPKPYIDSNASLVKVTETEQGGQWKLEEGGYKMMSFFEARGKGKRDAKKKKRHPKRIDVRVSIPGFKNWMWHRFLAWHLHNHAGLTRAQFQKMEAGQGGHHYLHIYQAHVAFRNEQEPRLLPQAL